MRKRNRLKYLIRIFALIITLLSILSITAFAVARCEDGAHTFTVELIQEATSDQPGMRRYTCTVCGYSYDEVIPATGHNWGEWITDVEPSCGVKGHAYRVCGKCGDTEVKTLPALQHNYSAITTPPSCLEAGKTVYTCTHCGDSYTETGAAALGHYYVLSEDKAETVGVDGYKKYTCTRCGDSYRETILALEAPAEVPVEPSSAVQPEPSIVPPAEVPPVTPPASVIEARSSDERQVLAEPVESAFHNKEEQSDSLNAYDLIFIFGMIATVAVFSVLTLPYIQVLKWAKRKKGDIIRRQRGAA